MSLLLHFLAVFFARHWLAGVLNGGLTLLLGLTLLRTTRRLFSPLRVLELRHLILLVSLYKGAFYLVLGDSLHAHASPWLLWGVQMPDPVEVLYVTRQSQDSIWHPATAAEWVGGILMGLTLVALLRRAWELRRSTRDLASYSRLGGAPQAPRYSAVLRRAAREVGLSAEHPLPRLLLAEVNYPTPLLLGVRHPYILLTPSLAASLSEQELEMAFRHELVHFRRRDHWRHWLLTWVGDVGCPNPLTRHLGAIASQTEEDICDRMAVHSSQDAQALAGAIVKALAVISSRRESPACIESAPPVSAVPALLGCYRHQCGDRSTVTRRLRNLLALANELAQGHRLGASSATSTGVTAVFRRQVAVRRLVHAIFWLLLFVILYLKYHLTPDIN